MPTVLKTKFAVKSMCFAILLFAERAVLEIFGTKIVPTAPKIHF
jgi:hypothetical protein